jgi:HAD superfamily hydrolase (TIGR01509 family)
MTSVIGFLQGVSAGQGPPDFEARSAARRVNRNVQAPFSRTPSFEASPRGGAMPSDLPRPDGLIFDLDGTLVDTVRQRIDGWVEALGALGLATTPEEVGPMIGMDGKRLARDVAEKAGRTLSEEEVEAADHAAGEAFDRRNREPRPLPGLADALAAIELCGARWVIATSSRAAQVQGSVAALGLESKPEIVDGSQVEHAKPEPDLLLLAAKRLGAAPDRCWAIGDSTWDARAAVAAGMSAVCITAGSAVGVGDLLAAGASVVVPTLAELARLLEEACLAPGG